MRVKTSFDRCVQRRSGVGHIASKMPGGAVALTGRMVRRPHPMRRGPDTYKAGSGVSPKFSPVLRQENRKSPDEAENHCADEQEGTGHGDVVDKKLPLGTARPAVAHGGEGAIGGTAAEFRISHSPTSLACGGRIPGLLQGEHECPPALWE